MKLGKDGESQTNEDDAAYAPNPQLANFSPTFGASWAERDLDRIDASLPEATRLAFCVNCLLVPRDFAATDVASHRAIPKQNWLVFEKVEPISRRASDVPSGL